MGVGELFTCGNAILFSIFCTWHVKMTDVTLCFKVEIKKAEPREARGSFGGAGRSRYGGGWDGPGMHGVSY